MTPKIILFVLALAASMTGSQAPCGEPLSAPSSKSETSTGMQSAATDFISLLEHEKFDDAEKRFDTTMRNALPVDQLQALWRATIRTNGDFEEAKKSSIQHVAQWDVVDTSCQFKKSSIVIRISFDKQRQVSGLFFLPATMPAPARDDGPSVQLKTATGTLFGTFDLPAGKPPWSVVLVIAGSGPTDRDGNSPQLKNDSLRLVGKALAAHDVAALRYDKRGVGQSAAPAPSEDRLRFENYVDDAGGWIKQLRSDKRFNKVVVLGYSEGSLIGILAAKQQPIDALISVAGAGRDAGTLLREQLKTKLPTNLYDQSSHIIDELAAGRRVDKVPPELTILFRPIVQPYLISWMKYNPAKRIAELKIPILIVQGTTDLQVSIEDAKLLAADNKNAKLVTIENMNHVLKYAPLKWLWTQLYTYSNPSLPLAPHLMDEILSFLRKT